MTGTILAAIAAESYAADAVEGGAAKRAGDNSRLPERAAEVVLQTLGLTCAEARDVANRPLPPGDFAAAPTG
ncbi:hypothetical protein [Burkholderia metallica]|uniref:hypothetical protein n=1 Tax=Burkholderia metallica TaxID=488729 RepID=UPI0020C68F95|nr:hypothetical protein [Burkholderia metallica]